MLGDIGIYGFRVMGENLARNIESKGYTVSIGNRSSSVIRDFMEGKGKDGNFVPSYSMEEFVSSLKKPRKIMLMIKAGSVVDATIDSILPLLDEGDTIIDGGNSNYEDTERRVKELQEKGIYFVGSGVSGGELGALYGPSIMPGGAKEAWEGIKDIFIDISAKAGKNGDEACTTWIGAGGSGHYVKTIHNGIEYGDMQLISETYAVMRDVLGLSNDEMAEVFTKWNKGVLESYLVEITADILGEKDEKGEYLVNFILDKAMQKGTGKWTVISALEEGQPVSLITEAVYARILSSMKDERVEASKLVKRPVSEVDKEETIKNLEKALYASKMVSYAQGFSLLKAASDKFEWGLNLGEIASIWRGGCIIRSAFLDDIRKAYDKNPKLMNLMVDDFFQKELEKAVSGLREIMVAGVRNGIAMPAMSSALAYYDGYHTENLPANLLQAQRDYFGAHMFERIDEERGEFFHHDWSGQGGNTASTVYKV
ncbi:decarboxylating NADP(+)-dependent phosphogluconate dehydrogenase [Proteiniclasticum sp. C24MP]|uniref:decarboxylating NADP(+)-dependent phosphogluconate dehydrogenase n=1 Tax=Proteiniclasticum sp. C24MP TaxID=3374101 RepID=UPI003753EA19